MRFYLPIETGELFMPEVAYDPKENIVEILRRNGSMRTEEEIICRAYVQLAEVDWDILCSDCRLD